MATSFLPCQTTILTSLFLPPSQLLLSSHRSNFFFCMKPHLFSPAWTICLHQHYCLFSSPSLPPASSPPGQPLHTDRGQNIQSHRLGLVSRCLPICLPPTSLLSVDREGIYWDHLSTGGTACKVLIDHLVVCALSHTLSSRKQLSEMKRRSALPELHTAYTLTSLDTENNSQEFQHFWLPV